MSGYKKAVAIDGARLDCEWLRHPELYMDLVEAKVEARESLDRAKDALSVLRAECNAKVRRSPERYGIDGKATEGAINAAVDEHPKIVAANARLLELRREHDLVSGAVDAMDHRKKALENLVQLHLSNYRSEPRAKRGDEEAIKQALNKPSQDGIATSINRRRQN